MLAPLLLSHLTGETRARFAFLVTVGVIAAVSVVLELVKRGEKNINAKDGFALVAICWIAVSVFGALPLWLSGVHRSYLDCLFEAVAGFTTTGGTVLPDFGPLGKGVALWYSLMQWIGGMGILVFLLMTVTTSVGEHTHNVLKAEIPGPISGKLVANPRRSVKLLYGIYVGLTLIQIIVYLFGGMSLFESICHALSTAGTGGFSVWSDSLGHYGSAYIEVATTVFMLLYGVNFTLFYLALTRNFLAMLKSEEFKFYLCIVAGSTAVIAANIFRAVYATFGEALRHAGFHVASVISTTFFYTVDYNAWPELSKMVLMALMFIGGCGGSTSGGLKVARIVILLKETRRILFRMSHPRSVEAVHFDGKALDKGTLHGVSTYILTYMLIFAASALLISVDNYDFETTFSAVLACINNHGHGFGLVGPLGNFSIFSPFSKVVLIFDMMAGRLELYPILLLFAPSTWRKV